MLHALLISIAVKKSGIKFYLRDLLVIWNLKSRYIILKDRRGGQWWGGLMEERTESRFSLFGRDWNSPDPWHKGKELLLRYFLMIILHTSIKNLMFNVIIGMIQRSKCMLWHHKGSSRGLGHQHDAWQHCSGMSKHDGTPQRRLTGRMCRNWCGIG